ncbi:MAG: hypothetical protein A2X25_00775 [Chloroflexi bacterium GWB2_49_20]|nr:MAG: hypothetical protein A2X25_00775 [Chloroflexi bacterium GWB2_49_20]OGN77555.1 MAG: hypothetical protein A2X26_02325 [Chloroflexi bacterium GWC2_49_37]OGN83182.1 MAG: hypothetical protein A2X27_13395 [Chloroflexi bacterium GWD2_49_16]
MLRKITLLYLVLLLGACSPASPTPVDSGIEGQVTIGPTCPVVQEGMDCADKPYQASFTVLTPAGDKVTQFQTDVNGAFKIALVPGDYILHPESPNVMPSAAEQPFVVLAGQFTRVDVAYDSGIR